MSFDLVCLGNLIVDDVVLADGRTRFGEAGGAMLYVSLAAALWGARVAIVAPVGTDYPRAALDALAERGIDLGGLRPLGRPGLRTWLLYEPRARRVVHHLGAPTHAEATPAPEDLRGPVADARAFHVSPSPRECQRRLVEALGARAGALVSLDPHDALTEASLDAWREVLVGVDLLFASEEEVALEGMEAAAPDRTDSGGTLARLRGGRLARIAVKRGARGGVVYDVSSGRDVPWTACAFGAVVDPTGAGDAFAGGMLAGLLRGDMLDRAIARGAVTASFAIEAWGAHGLFAATRHEAERRLATWLDRAESAPMPSRP